MKKLCSTMCLLGMIGSPALAADISIQNIAPENSIIVVGSSGLDGIWQKVQSMGVMDLLTEEGMSEILGEQIDFSIEDMKAELDAMREQLSLNEDDPKLPSGNAGFALYMADQDGMQVPAMMFYAELGANATDFNRFVDRLLEFGESEGELSWEEGELVGRTMLTFDMSEGEMNGGGMDDEFDFDQPPLPFELPSSMHLIRSDNLIMIGSEPNGLAEALELIDSGDASAFADNDEYQGAMAEIGTGDVYGVVMVNQLFNMMGSMDPMMGMVRPMIGRFVGDIRSLGFTATLAGSSASVEQALSVYMPMGKSGLSAVFDAPDRRGEMPTFAGEDAYSYTALNVKFDALTALIQEVMAMAGPMMGAGGGEMDQMMQIIQPMMDALGSRVHMYSTRSGPVADGNFGSVTAIECTDAQAFEDAFGGFAPQMGMEPRDFLGQRIYSMDPAMMGMMGGGGESVSIGIGSGFVFIGNDASVEQALRSGAADADTSLADNPGVANGLALLDSNDVVAWGVSNPVDTMLASMYQQLATQKMMANEMREFDPEFADQLEEEFEGMETMLKNMNVERLREVVGPSVWQFISNDNGYIMRSYMTSGSGGE